MTKPAMTKADFARSRPADMPVAEIVAEGRRLGLDMKPADVRMARKVGPPKKERKRGKRRESSEVREMVLKAIRGLRGPLNEFRELAPLTGLHPKHVQTVLKRLRAEGAVTFTDRQAGTLALGPKATTQANGHAPARLPAKAIGAESAARVELERALAELEEKARKVREVIALLDSWRQS